VEKAKGKSMVGFSPEDARFERLWREAFPLPPTSLRDWLPAHYKQIPVNGRCSVCGTAMIDGRCELCEDMYAELCLEGLA